MSKTKKTINETVIIDAVLKIMATKGIHKTTLADVAKKLKTDTATLYPFIQSPHDVFNLITRQTNQALAKDYQYDANIPKRDQYFDIIMERFDLLQPYKKDIGDFIKKMPQNPLTLTRFFPDFERAIILIMQLAGDTAKDKGHYSKRLALTWVYLSTMRVWMKDDSADAAKTMAHLDKSLSRIDGLKEKFSIKKRYAA